MKEQCFIVAVIRSDGNMPMIAKAIRDEVCFTYEEAERLHAMITRTYNNVIKFGIFEVEIEVKRLYVNIAKEQNAGQNQTDPCSSADI